MMQMSYCHLAVQDLAWWRQFGEQVGYAVEEDASGDRLYWRTDSERDYRWAIEAVGSKAPTGLRRVGWELSDQPLWHATQQRLDTLGYTATPATGALLQARRVEEMFWLDGPDALTHEVHWGANCALRKPLSLDVLARFESGPYGNGHITINVDDDRRVLAFATEGLGLRLSDAAWMEGHSRVYFLRCNPRHHSYAFAQVSRQPTGTMHVMSDLRNLDQLGQVRDRLLTHGFQLSRDLGSHPLDGVVSIYVATPEGFEFELACGTRWINEATWEQDKFQRQGLAWGHRRSSSDAK